MARGNSILDKYPQWALLEVAGAASNTGISVQRLVTGITTMQKMGWEIIRCEYRLPLDWITHAVLQAANNFVQLGISQSNSLLQPMNFNNPSLLDLLEYVEQQVVTAVGVLKYGNRPIIHDFGNNPILCIPANIHAILNWATTGALNTSLCQIRVWYREVELGPEDWYDLLQLRLPLGAI